jgi:hypothetical protein
MECHKLMGLDVRSHFFQAFGRIPSYSSWLVREADLTSTYRYQRRVMKLRQWGCPPAPRATEVPSHLLWVGYLDRVFPDARFAMTHRDPTDVLVSMADLYGDSSRTFADEPVDPRYFGQLGVEHWSLAMERVLAFRDAGNDDRFYDIGFRAMQRDPLGEIRGLSAWLGEPVSDTFDDGLRHWWRENGENREPNTHPDPAFFGLDPDRIRPLFADYVSHAAVWTAR